MSGEVRPINYHRLHPGATYYPIHFFALNASVKKRFIALADHCFEAPWYVMALNIASFTITDDTVTFETFKLDDKGKRIFLENPKTGEKFLDTEEKTFPYGINWIKDNT